jgi:UDP-glucose-4-epimerase GalE
MSKRLRVLVTGGCGFVGSHVAYSLVARGYTPLIYDNLSSGHREFASALPMIEGDIRESRTLREALRGVDSVFHFAAHIEVSESVRDPGKYFDNNVIGSLVLMRAAAAAGVKHFIFSSSAAVYGTPDSVPIAEEAPIRPINPYGLSKAFIEQALAVTSQASGMKHMCLRYFNAAGAHVSGLLAELHDPETHLIPSLLLTAAGMRNIVKIYGTDYPTPDGTCVRDFVHVSDLADAHVLALEYLLAGGNSTAVNIGLGEGHSVLEVVREVERITGKILPKELAPRRLGDPAVLVADCSRARALLGWQPSRRLPNIVETAHNALVKHHLAAVTEKSARIIEMAPPKQRSHRRQ